MVKAYMMINVLSFFIDCNFSKLLCYLIKFASTSFTFFCYFLFISSYWLLLCSISFFIVCFQCFRASYGKLHLCILFIHSSVSVSFVMSIFWSCILQYYVHCPGIKFIRLMVVFGNCTSRFTVNQKSHYCWSGFMFWLSIYGYGETVMAGQFLCYLNSCS